MGYKSIALATLLILSTSANAGYVTFDVDWSFSDDITDETAGLRGTIDFDIASLSAPQSFLYPAFWDLSFTRDGVETGVMVASYIPGDSFFSYDGAGAIHITYNNHAPSSPLEWADPTLVDVTITIYKSGLTEYVGLWYPTETVTTLQGSTTNFAMIPIPAAVWLFGSGLLVLVGVARSKRQT